MDPRISEILQNMHKLDQMLLQLNIDFPREVDQIDPNAMQNYFGSIDESHIPFKYWQICNFYFKFEKIVCEKSGLSFDTREINNENFGNADPIINAALETKEKVTKPFSLIELSIAAVVKAKEIKRLDTEALLNLYNCLYEKKLTVRAGENRSRKFYDVLTIIKHHMYEKNGLTIAPENYFQDICTNVRPVCVECSISRTFYTCYCVICQFFDSIKRCTDLLEKNGHHTECCN